MNVTDLSGLSGVTMGSLKTGDTVFVETLRSRFVLDRSSTTPIDAISVVATSPPLSGRWLRLPIAHPSWLRQATWFIDPVSGDDERDGSTKAKAIKTHAELTRRWGTDFKTVLGADSALPAPVLQVITVVLLKDLPASDPINLKITLGPNTLLAYLGTPEAEVRKGGTLAVVDVRDRRTNTPWTVKDTDGTPGAAFTAADVGKRVRITGGAGPGQFAWIAKDLKDGVMRMSSFSEPTMPGLPDVLKDESTLTSNDAAVAGTYVVERLTQVTIQSIQVDGPLAGAPHTAPVIGFVNIDFKHPGPVSSDPKKRKLQLQSGVRGIKAVFKGCSWDGTLVLSADTTRHWYLNCRFQHLALNRVGALFRGGLCIGEISYRGGIAAFDDDFMCQGHVGFRVQSSGILFGTVCVFDSEEAGVHLGVASAWPCSAACLSLPEGSKAHHLWGAGNKGGGVSVGGGSVLSYESTPPTVTGSQPGVDDFILGGSKSARAFDEVLGLPTSKHVNSWVNLLTPTASGGFGGNAHNFERDAHIVLR